MYSVHNFLVIVARASHKLVLEDLNNLQPFVVVVVIIIIIFYY